MVAIKSTPLFTSLVAPTICQQAQREFRLEACDSEHVAAKRVLSWCEGGRELRGHGAEAAAVARIGLEKLEVAARRTGIGIIKQADVETEATGPAPLAACTDRFILPAASENTR